MPEIKAMLYVLCTPGEKNPIDEFNSWFDNKHIPLRMKLPGFLRTGRYVAIDGQEPEWLAVYELDGTEVLQSLEYLDQWKAAGPSMMERLNSFEFLERRIYVLDREWRSSDYDKKCTNPILQPVALSPVPDLPLREFDAWYTEEHIPLLSQVPGWLRSSRWVLQDSGRPGAEDPEGKARKKVSPYLAVHEWESTAAWETSEFKKATSTPWREKIMVGIDPALENRRKFRTHRLFTK